MKKIKVHIADNHKILVEGVIAVLQAHDIEIEGYSTSGPRGNYVERTTSGRCFIIRCSYAHNGWL